MTSLPITKLYVCTQDIEEQTVDPSIENGPSSNCILVMVIWMVRNTSIVHTGSDAPLVSMVKDMDKFTVWSNRPENKYDPVPDTLKTPPVTHV